MKFLFSTLLVSVLFISSCQEDSKSREKQQEKEAQKRETIFNTINKGWKFNSRPTNETSLLLTKNWVEWRVFLNELAQKPKSSISAFQHKSKTLSKDAMDLNNNIPVTFDLPEVKSRISVIATKVNLINLYIHLNQISDKKIVQLVKETNDELLSFQNKLDEINRKSQIKLEDGEVDMLQMLDTARAIPTATPVVVPSQKRLPGRLLKPFRNKKLIQSTQKP